MSTVRVTIVGKPDCHLCDVAGEVVRGVVADLGDGTSVEIEKVSILDDPALHERYWEQIPVVLVNGIEHAHWRVDPDAFRATILAA